MKKNFAALIALAAMFQLANVDAAAIDNEIAILAAEQDTQNEAPKKTEEVKKPVKKSKQEIEAEKKRLREEQKAAEKKLKEEQKAARKQIEEGKKEQIRFSDSNRNSRTNRTSTTERSSVTQNPAVNTSSNVTPSTSTVKTAQTNSTSSTTTARTNLNSNATTSNNSSVGKPNPVKEYASFDEVTKAVGFTPLYIPKKSGYTATTISVVGERMAQIKYGRRWEPEVSLYIRTYKRLPNEELKDISGINGVKWRVDMTGGTTVYVAKIADDKHAAAWAFGSYTFAAYAENLSFAAFHALVVEELVDLSAHYYTN